MRTLRNVFFTTIMALGLSSTAQANWSWHTGWNSGSHCTSSDTNNNHHGRSWGDWCNNKGSKGSHGSWGNWGGHKGSHNKCWNWCDGKGSKGSHDKGSHCHTYKWGKVLGLVFEDTNNNGTFDRCIDKRLKDVTVTITDADGTIYHLTTNCRGIFYARNLATGEAVIDINESTLPSGSSIVIGTDPDTVNINSCGIPTWHYYGYGLPAPTGNMSGLIFEDTNGNGVWDNSETGVSGISITLIDANGDSHTTQTDNEGKYTFSNIVVGTATITIDENTLPANAELTVGENPSEITIKADGDSTSDIDGYTITMPTGALTGSVINDLNHNGQIDNGESGIAGITVIITDADGEEHSVITDANGNYSIGDLPVGTATVTIDRTTLPQNAVLTIGEDPNSVEVVAGRTVDAGIDGYEIQSTTGNIYGMIFEDSNYNGQKDANESGITGIDVIITDSEGNTHIVTTDTNGNYSLTDLPEGSATIEVNETTLPENAGLTIGENPNTVEISTDTSIDAGIDGYAITALHGTIFSDDNGNGIQDNGEVGVENIHIIITDANGNDYDVYTDNVGNYMLKDIPSGQTHVEVDTDSLPDGTVLTSGTNPKEIDLPAYKNTNIGDYGYGKKAK